MDLSDPVTAVPVVGPARAGLLARMGVATVRALLALPPRRYEDRRRRDATADLAPGAPGTFAARVAASGAMVTPRRRRRVFRATLEDPTGRIEALWFRFREADLAARLAPGSRVLVHGTVRGANGARELLHPEVERLGDEGRGCGPEIRPVYPATAGLAQAVLRSIVRGALTGTLPGLSDPLPVALRARLRLAGLAEALAAVHAPGAEAGLELLERPSFPRFLAQSITPRTSCQAKFQLFFLLVCPGMWTFRQLTRLNYHATV